MNVYKLLGFILFFSLGVFSFFGYKFYEIKKFRDIQKYSYFVDQFNSDTPTSYISRLLITRNGSAIYNNTIKHYLLNTKVSENSLNIEIYKKLFEGMGDKELIDNLQKYPFNINTLSTETLSRLTGKNSCSYLKTKINKSNSLKYVINSSSEDNNDKSEKPDTIDYHLNPDDANFDQSYLKIIKSIDSITPQDNILNCALNTFFSKEPSYKNDFIYLAVSDYKGNIKKIFDALLPNEPIPLVLIAAGLNNSTPEENKITKKFIEKNHNRFTPNEFGVLSNLIKENKKNLEYIFKLSTKNNGISAINVFHSIIHNNLLHAEEIGKHIIESKDSTLKKGVIVLLNRHYSVMAGSYIDKAFKGSHTRVTPVKQTYYIDNSDAVSEYKAIAKHDLKQTGKLFPPIYCEEPDHDESDHWRVFINKYPWFPATDDAYYRLIFRLVTDGDIKSAIHYLNKYKQVKFADTDAHQLIKLLEKKIKKREYDDFKLIVMDCKSDEFVDYIWKMDKLE